MPYEGYRPTKRTLTTEYIVATSGDRYFPSVLAPDATAAEEIANNQAVIGTGESGATVASERVAS